MRAAESTNRSFDEVELEVCGFEHAELGSLIAAEWKFPPALCEALRYHHHPEGAVVDPGLARSIHCADWVANRMGIGLVSPGSPEWPEEMARAEFQIDQHSIGALESEIRAEFLEGSSLKAA